MYNVASLLEALFMKLNFLFFICFCLVTFSVQPVYSESSDYPESARERRREGFGSILGRDEDIGGVTIFGKTLGKSNNDQQAKTQAKNDTSSSKSTTKKSNASYSNKKSSKNINSYLWQAALSSVQSMPILVSDSSGGVLSTDWYEDSEIPDERYKFNILINTNEIGDNALNVTSFKQKFEDGKWRDVKVNSEVAKTMKNKIFSKAKELKAQKQK